MFFLNSSGQYEPLTLEAYEKIVGGVLRFQQDALDHPRLRSSITNVILLHIHRIRGCVLFYLFFTQTVEKKIVLNVLLFYARILLEYQLGYRIIDFSPLYLQALLFLIYRYKYQLIFHQKTNKIVKLRLTTQRVHHIFVQF